MSMFPEWMQRWLEDQERRQDESEGLWLRLMEAPAPPVQTITYRICRQEEDVD